LIEGVVTDYGIPVILIPIAGRNWRAAIDTYFNGDIMLPWELADDVEAEYEGGVYSVLANGSRIREDSFQVSVPFDGEVVRASATFTRTDELVIGTRLLKRHRLEISFLAATVLLTRED
jgi:predicted aspartyl protease